MNVTSIVESQGSVVELRHELHGVELVRTTRKGTVVPIMSTQDMGLAMLQMAHVAVCALAHEDMSKEPGEALPLKADDFLDDPHPGLLPFRVPHGAGAEYLRTAQAMLAFVGYTGQRCAMLPADGWAMRECAYRLLVLAATSEDSAVAGEAAYALSSRPGTSEQHSGHWLVKAAALGHKRAAQAVAADGRLTEALEAMMLTLSVERD